METKRKLDILRGARNIGKPLGLTERQAFHMLQAGLIEGAFKKGRLWYVPYQKLCRQFGFDDEGKAA